MHVSEYIQSVFNFRSKKRHVILRVDIEVHIGRRFQYGGGHFWFFIKLNMWFQMPEVYNAQTILFLFASLFTAALRVWVIWSTWLGGPIGGHQWVSRCHSNRQRRIVTDNPTWKLELRLRPAWRARVNTEAKRNKL